MDRVSGRLETYLLPRPRDGQRGKENIVGMFMSNLLLEVRGFGRFWVVSFVSLLLLRVMALYDMR